MARVALVGSADAAWIESEAPPTIPPPAPAPAPTPAADVDPMQQMEREMRALARQRVVEALARTGGNQTKAARMLGISRRTLTKRLNEFALPRPRKR
jgi:DNA-binding NtrC family response regulator